MCIHAPGPARRRAGWSTCLAAGQLSSGGRHPAPPKLVGRRAQWTPWRGRQRTIGCRDRPVRAGTSNRRSAPQETVRPASTPLTRDLGTGNTCIAVCLAGVAVEGGVLQVADGRPNTPSSCEAAGSPSPPRRAARSPVSRGTAPSAARPAERSSLARSSLDLRPCPDLSHACASRSGHAAWSALQTAVPSDRTGGSGAVNAGTTRHPYHGLNDADGASRSRRPPRRRRASRGWD